MTGARPFAISACSAVLAALVLAVGPDAPGPSAASGGASGPAAVATERRFAAAPGGSAHGAQRVRLHDRGATRAARTAAPTPPFRLDLYRRGDFASQVTRSYCIPAAIVTMMNIADPGPPHSTTMEPSLYRIARTLSTWRLVGDGAEAEGWAGALNHLGYGPYRVYVATTRAAALRVAATAIRLTRRPVGLVVWHGAHAWVMSGFTSTADPGRTSRFTVTHVYVEDPWYPRPNSLWGSHTPDSLVSVSALAADLLPFHRPTVRYPDKDGRFVIVLPVASGT